MDAQAGVAWYDLDVSVDGGPWQRVLTRTLSTTHVHTCTPANFCTFRLTATDHVSNAASAVARTSVVRVTKYYYHGGTRVALRTTGAGGGVVYWLHGDHLGSVSLVTDHASRVVAQQRFLPYGGVRYSEGTFPTDVGFTGRRGHPALGLVYMRARYYHVALGRFVSADTVVPNPLSPQLFNRYSYAGNSPVLYNDPDGHCGPLCILGVAAALVAVLMLTSDVPPPPDSPVAYSRSGNQRVGEVAFGVAGSYGVASLVVPGVTVPVTAQTVAGTAAAGACADGNCTNEVEATASFVRKFTSGDMDALRNFSRRALQIQSQRGMKSFGEQWEMLGEIAAQQPEAANNLFTFQRDGIVEGAMRVREISGQFWITHLEGFGGGAGTELVKAAIQESIARGYEGTIHLIPAPQAISFYENLGFTLVRIGPGGAEYVLTAEVAKKLLGQ